MSKYSILLRFQWIFLLTSTIDEIKLSSNAITCTEETGLSIEDKRFLTIIVEELVVKKPDGHFKIALLFKQKNIKMSNNKSQAEACIHSRI